MDEIKLIKLLDKVKYKVLDNGFKIIYYSSDEYEKYYINYATKYGGVDYTYKKNKKVIKHNPGIAHFLEHVMFNMEYGDAFEKFSTNLASANAYTSYTKTSYLFSTSQKVQENLKILLDMVNEFYLTEEKVEKEKGIILEEIGMYDKNPDWQIYKQSLKNSINSSKYKEDILGSPQDVKGMTLKMLKEAYEDFYVPQNQYITIVGPNVDSLVEYVEQYMLNKVNKKDEIEKYDNETVKENITQNKLNEYYMDVSQNYLSLTYKELNDKTYNIEDKIYIEILLELLFTNFNDQYIKYEEEKKLDYSFMYDFILYKNFKLIIFYISNKSMQEFEQTIDKLIEKKCDDEFIQVIQNKFIGKMLKNFDDEKSFAEMLNNFEANEIDLKKYYNILCEVNKSKIDKQINEQMIKIKTKISNKML